jgi:hypothetical protein
MQGRHWSSIAIVASIVFAVAGVARLVSPGDTIAFAHLTFALGLVLFALRERGTLVVERFRYLPEVVLVLALGQYGYTLLGV